MPTRIVRESLLSSERYWSVSLEARMLYIHILLLADDFGCLSLAPFHLKKMCFDSPPSDQRLARHLGELVDEDLVRRYEFNGAVYGFVPRFRQRLQRMTLKHPMPPQSLYQDDSDALEKFNRIKFVTRNPTVGQPFPNRSPTDEVEVKGIEKKRSEDTATSTAGINPVEGQRQKEPHPENDGLHMLAMQLGIKQLDGETRGAFSLRVAQAAERPTQEAKTPTKGKFEDE